MRLCGIAAHYRIAIDRTHLQRELTLVGRDADITDLMRAAAMIGMNARRVSRTSKKALVATPTPALVQLRQCRFVDGF